MGETRKAPLESSVEALVALILADGDGLRAGFAAHDKARRNSRIPANMPARDKTTEARI